MRACGKRWETEAGALSSKRALADPSLVAEKCSCGGWHLKASVKPRTPLRQGRDTGPSPEVKKAVYERDGWCCACCGTFLARRPHSIGHRQRRAQGVDNSMPNLLAFLGLGVNPLDPDDHHARIDSRLLPSDAARGLSLKSGQVPAEVPVEYMTPDGLDGRWLTHDGRRLTDDERRLTEPPEGVTAS